MPDRAADAPPSHPDTSDPGTAPVSAAAGKPLTPAARRALEEAEARRSAADQARAAGEQGGPPGLEPTRFGDWERKGIAIDF